MYGKFLVPSDGSKFSEQILPCVRSLADAYKTPVELLRIADPDARPLFGGPEAGDKYLKEIVAKYFPAPARAVRRVFPVNVLNPIKMVPEVCRVFCATANPVEVVIAETDQGPGIMGVIDGGKSKGMEDENGIVWRKELLRKIGYKL